DYPFAPNVKDVDSDVINPAKDDVGQWRRDKAIRVDRDAAQSILDGRFFLRNCAFKEKELKTIVPMPSENYGRCCRVLRIENDYVAATSWEGDKVEFYCRPADIVGQNGRKGLTNMPDWDKEHATFRCSA